MAVALVYHRNASKMKNLAHTIRLSLALAKANFKLRNEGTYLGILWYLLNPLLLFTLLFLIFSDRLGQDIEFYPLYLLLGIIMFNFFQQAATEATKIIDQNRHLIKSINFPREALPLSIAVKSLFSHGFEIIVFALFMIVLGVPLWGIFFYPLVLLFFVLFVFGAALLFSAITTYFADFENIWLFVSRLLFFGTPIFYAIEGQNRLFLVNIFNPLYYYITAARDIVIYSTIPELWIILGVAGYSLVSLGTGWLIFKKLKPKFAEMI